MTFATNVKTLQLATDKDLPVSVYLSSDHGFDPTGKTITVGLATSKGGTIIASPDTAITLTEDTTTESDRRLYAGTIDKAVVNTLLGSSTEPYWLNISESGGAVSEWYEVPVAPDSYSELA